MIIEEDGVMSLDDFIKEVETSKVLIEMLEHSRRLHKEQMTLLYIQILWWMASPQQRRKYRPQIRAMKKATKLKIKELKRESRVAR